MSQTCGNCNKASNGSELKRCGGCKKVWYCNQTCQRAHWHSGHKNECSPKPAHQQRPLFALSPPAKETKKLKPFDYNVPETVNIGPKFNRLPRVLIEHQLLQLLDDASIDEMRLVCKYFAAKTPITNASGQPLQVSMFSRRNRNYLFGRANFGTDQRYVIRDMNATRTTNTHRWVAEACTPQQLDELVTEMMQNKLTDAPLRDFREKHLIELIDRSQCYPCVQTLSLKLNTPPFVTRFSRRTEPHESYLDMCRVSTVLAERFPSVTRLNVELNESLAKDHPHLFTLALDAAAGRWSHLRHLTLCKLIVSAQTAHQNQNLVRALKQQCTQLDQVDLQSIFVEQDADFKLLAELPLVSVSFKNCSISSTTKVTGVGFAAWAERKITHLQLGSIHTFTNEGMHCVARLSSLQCLRTCCGDNITAEGFHALQGAQSLRQLHIQTVATDRHRLSQLIQQAVLIPHLEHLSIQETYAQEDARLIDLVALAKSIQLNLKVLNIKTAGSQGRLIAGLRFLLQRCTHLTDVIVLFDQHTVLAKPIRDNILQLISTDAGETPLKINFKLYTDANRKDLRGQPLWLEF